MTPARVPPPAPEPAWEIPPEMVPDLTKLVTQDDTPVDRIFTEKQQRLLTEPLYSSWSGPGDGTPFLALANVGYSYAYRKPPLVPDALLALDATTEGDLQERENHSYYQWAQGKSPDVVIEIVSDRSGGEDGHQLRAYARAAVPFFVIFDPENWLAGGVLRGYALQRKRYEPTDPAWLPEVKLGLKLWDGVFEGNRQTWLRWCDQKGRVIPTGAERAAQEHARAAKAKQLATRAKKEASLAKKAVAEERNRAKAAEEKARRLAAKLRELGVDPEA